MTRASDDDGTKVRRYPFESFAWDDELTNNNRWCDAAEVEAAFDLLKQERDEYREALKDIRWSWKEDSGRACDHIAETVLAMHAKGEAT